MDGVPLGLLALFLLDSFRGCSKEYVRSHKEFHSTYEHTSFKFPKSKIIYIFLFRAASDSQVSWLEISTVWAWDELPIVLIAREPGLKVVFFGSCVIECAWNNRNDSVGKSKWLIELLGKSNHIFMGLPWVLWLGDNELLNLLELVHSENSPSVFSMGPCLLPEAWGTSPIFDRKLGLFDPLVSVHGWDGLFWSGYQVEVFLLSISRNLVELVVKVAKLAGFSHNFLL